MWDSQNGCDSYKLKLVHAHFIPFEVGLTGASIAFDMLLWFISSRLQTETFQRFINYTGCIHVSCTLRHSPEPCSVQFRHNSSRLKIKVLDISTSSRSSAVTIVKAKRTEHNFYGSTRSAFIYAARYAVSGVVIPDVVGGRSCTLSVDLWPAAFDFKVLPKSEGMFLPAHSSGRSTAPPIVTTPKLS